MTASLLASAALPMSATRSSSRSRLAGRILTGIAVLFLAFDTAIKFSGAKEAVEGTENLLFTHILFPIYIAALIWGGLYLRDSRVRALLRAER